jgi:UDP-N-acetylmuramate--alanine ligase
MELNKIKNVHIIGIGGCASSAIAELLCDNGIKVSGSEMKERSGMEYLEKKGAVIRYMHDENNLYLNGSSPDIVLFSPAVMNLDPNNPEIVEAKNRRVPLESWQNFIGDFLSGLGKTGITVSGSEGKGTTAGILTKILKGTEHDPLSILGARLKKINGGEDSNIYTGKGGVYILEADEFNRNFLNYHPSINIMVNFEYDHPETYGNFDEYMEGFHEFFSGMRNEKILVLKASPKIIALVSKYGLEKTHKISWFGKPEELERIDGTDELYVIKNHVLDARGNSFAVSYKGVESVFQVPAFPGYIAYNATGAIVAAMKLGLPPGTIGENLRTFTGMDRRFDLYRTANGGVMITDYGHSPESLNHIIGEIRSLFPDKIIHLVFQPHLFSRTYNFFGDFVGALKKADRISVIDIYPAREREDDWKDRVSSVKLCDALKRDHNDVFYAGKSRDIHANLAGRIKENDITCFIGAGDMNLYYGKILDGFGAKN